MPIWRIALTFRDREGNERNTSLCTSSATVVAELVAFAQGLEAALAPLSNARIVAATITTRWEYNPGPASPNSDVRRKGLLIARDFEEPSTYESILIHSPRYLPGTSNSGGGWSWVSPARNFDTWPDTSVGRMVFSWLINTLPRNAILDLLDIMVRLNNSAFPNDDFIYAELSQ